MLLSPVWMLIPFDLRATKFGILSRHGRGMFFRVSTFGTQKLQYCHSCPFPSEYRAVVSNAICRSATCSFATVEISAKHASVFGAVIELGTAYRGC